MFKSSKLRRPPMEDNLKISNVEYLSNHCIVSDFGVLRGKLEENSEEITSVALLSPACYHSLFNIKIVDPNIFVSFLKVFPVSSSRSFPLLNILSTISFGFAEDSAKPGSEAVR